MSKFTIMPTKIFELGLDPAQIALFAAMCCKIDDNGFVDTTYIKLGELCGRSKPWVVETITKLENNRLIKRENSSVRILYDGQYSDLTGQPTEQQGQSADHPLSSSNLITTTNNSTKRESRKTTLPKDFKPTDENLEWAIQKRPDLDLDSITENFILYAETHSTKYVNWQSAWKKWIKMERQNDKIAKTSPHARSQENTDRGRKNIAAVLERRSTGISTD